MTRTELLKLTKEALRKEFSLPLVGTSVETVIVDKVCDLAFPFIPDEALSLLVDASDGLTADEIAAHEASIVAYLNRSVDLPYLHQLKDF